MQLGSHRFGDANLKSVLFLFFSLQKNEKWLCYRWKASSFKKYQMRIVLFFYCCFKNASDWQLISHWIIIMIRIIWLFTVCHLISTTNNCSRELYFTRFFIQVNFQRPSFRVNDIGEKWHKMIHKRQERNTTPIRFWNMQKTNTKWAIVGKNKNKMKWNYNWKRISNIWPTSSTDLA